VRPLVDQLTLKWFVRDLDIRAVLIANTVQDPLVELVRANARPKIAALFNRIAEDERLYALGFCDAQRRQFIGTRTFPADIGCDGLDRFADGDTRLLASAKGPLHVVVETLRADNETLGKLVVVHDMSFIARRSEETKRYVFWFLVALGALVSLITVVVAQLSWRGWVQGMKAVLRGEGLLRRASDAGAAAARARPAHADARAGDRLPSARRKPDHLDPGDPARHPARRPARRRDPRRLQPRALHPRAARESNRGPAPGERPVQLGRSCRACSGRGLPGGPADREVVDRHDRGRAPVLPHPPRGSAPRKGGYYCGFSNEGLWPLCHIAHVRPTFRADDWNRYVEVNKRFARTVVAESRSANPIVLVQDYHLALLPKLVRDQLPDATIITFWHIPWPNPEAFGILPWREEVLAGLLGSSILGFHTRFHVNNFVDTVDRELEARVDRETLAVTYGGRTTAVKRYPISIEWPPAEAASWRPVPECRAAVRALRDRRRRRVGIGVGRPGLHQEGFSSASRAVETCSSSSLSGRRFTFVRSARRRARASSSTRSSRCRCARSRPRSMRGSHAAPGRRSCCASSTPSRPRCTSTFAPRTSASCPASTTV
jgi:trehalose 6-phosphate synthase